MANIRISELPNFTGSTSGSWLVANNSSQSGTFKIQRESFLNGYATSNDLSSLSSSIAVTDLNQNNVIGTLATTSSVNSAISSLSSSIALTDFNQDGAINAAFTGIFNLSSSIAITDLNQNNVLATTASVNSLSGSIAVTDLNQTNRLVSIENKTGSFATTGSNVFIGNQTITGSLMITGSVIETGSVQGNVIPLSIVSNTASLNLNDGNFFTLQLVSGTATRLNPSNIKPGQTVSIFVNTVGSATMTFPSSIKQISGSAYVPTTTTGTDVLTLISRDSSNLFLVNAKNFI